MTPNGPTRAKRVPIPNVRAKHRHRVEQARAVLDAFKHGKAIELPLNGAGANTIRTGISNHIDHQEFVVHSRSGADSVTLWLVRREPVPAVMKRGRRS